MEERTLHAFKALLLLTGLRLVHEGVEELLLPPVAHAASLQAFAALLVAGDERPRLPVLTQVDLIRK